MPIRFLHTADLQIGKGFGRFPPEVAGRLRAERLAALKRIAVLAHERRVDAVLVAGDCFDDIAVADETLRRFRVALEPFSGMWLLLPGNHDPAVAESPWTRLKRLGLPDNVLVADDCRPLEIAGRAVVLPAPVRRKREAADVTEWFDSAATSEGLIRIGLAHGSVQDFLPTASEAPNPVALDRARRAELDYLALGDWHGKLRVDERTWYAGTPEPDRFKANEPGFALDVIIEGPRALPQVEPVPVGGLRWIERTIEITPGGAGDVSTAIPSDGSVDACVVRLNLEGTVDLATQRLVEDATEELKARVLHLEVNDDNLTVAPSQADLDSIATSGFVGEAVERLRGKLDGTEANTARRALALLYGLRQRSGG